jgi:Protein of unknown function (DUF3604)
MKNVTSKIRTTISPKQVAAGLPCTFTVEYTVGRGGISEGGGIELKGWPRNSWWAIPQVLHPGLAGYVGATVDSDKTRVVAEVVSGCFPIIIRVTALGALLKKGNKISVVFGDSCEGGAGLVAPPYTHKFKFIVSVDKNGSGDFSDAGGTPELNIVGDKVERLSVVAPSIVTVGEQFNVVLTAETNWLNPVNGRPPIEYRAKVRFKTSNTCRTPSRITFTGQEKGVKKLSASISSAGIRLLRVEDVTHSIKAKSNPIKCYNKEPEHRLYWGDLHVHSTAWDGQLTPEECYKYASDVAGLDFAVVSEHVMGLTDDDWEAIKRAAKKYNVPREFVTFLAFEWRNSHGHRNVYFRDGNQPRFVDENIKKLWKFLNDKEAMIIGHPHIANDDAAKRFNWDSHNPKYERVAEVCSCVGHCERFANPGMKSNVPSTGRYVQDALARGHKLGMIASTDSHSSHAGKIHGYGWEGAITGVYAKELTRESLWEALWNRRCYGTTGVRIILDFKLNGHDMGKEIFAENNRKIEVRVSGTTKIEKVDIVRNNKDIYTYKGRTSNVSFEYDDKDDLNNCCAYYYIRVMQADGNMAWSSPIWVNSSN